ncbi:hypothetical protein PQJ75_03680 [Rhodoplanes sp. TEM]|uniref:Uncharacterized protein n=1 Tax=Rhodoplanes tepidamans TaxID=200616 RepID=A0ABT5J919_RHOTP|nr:MULTISPECIES: hypothetical protein [Rhodoplanes]MDC7786152.1 hypothetical protein [Rhodoplanes tepidamans]MDC7982819.1 hypothetical protein [Rhodoplanes sp. TEM]MDQ0357183.1 hypothetical protein [Rhodoplanes tepidamans]
MEPSSLVPAGASGRDDPAEVAAERAGDRDLPAVDPSEDLVSGFAMTVRSPYEDLSVEDGARVLEVDPVGPQVGLALVRVPAETLNPREAESP